jgi:hypothetical protein
LGAPPPGEKSRRTNLSEVAARVYWRDTFSRFETAWAHWQVARVLDPKGYRKTIAFPPVWFLRVYTGARTPRFMPVRAFRADGAHTLGPLATRHDADEWLHMLEDLFDLCRYDGILEQAPHGRACAYFEMGKCPAPCDGTISIEAYQQMITEAIRFSSGDSEPRFSALREAMHAAARDQAFEKAAAIRQTAERASATVKKREYRHLADLSACCWLIIQRGGPARRAAKNLRVKPFFVRSGLLEPGDPVTLADLESAVPCWLACCGRCSVLVPSSQAEQTARCEVLWLVAKFLFQAERAPGLFYRFDQLPDAERLVREIRERFGPQTPDEPVTPETAD